MIYGKTIKIQKPKYKLPDLTEEDIVKIKQTLPNWFKEKYSIELEDNVKILDDHYWVSVASVIRLLKTKDL